ncbi:MAG: T9SS type A sorting domain-containing protein [Saprospiraceae bacterium]
MKRPIFTFMSVNNLIDLMTKKSTVAFSILITLLTINSYTVSAQVNCDVILACNNNVQISLDEDCNMYIEPEMILKGLPFAEDYFDVEAKLPDGTKLSQTTVGNAKWANINSTHIGTTLEVKVDLRGCGNSCWGYAKIEDKLAPVIDPENCPCEERITLIEGAIMNASPSFNRPSVVSGCPGTPINGVQYATHNFALDASGIVDISLPTTSVKFSLYSGVFDPLNPCTNLVATTAQSWSGSLVTGVNYTLVVSLNEVPLGSLPPTGESYDLFIDNRSGNIKSNVSASICIVTCGNEDAILAQTAANAPNKPGIVDGCGGPLTYNKVDYVDELQCSEDYAKVIRRVWTATDASGNVSLPKTQYYYVQRASLSAVMCPADYIRSCTAPYQKLANGLPSPATTGYPTNLSCSNIQYYYEDLFFDLCGAGFKVYRKWYIIDWCTGAEKTCDQLIKFEDTEGPVVTCPADLTAQNGTTINPAAVVPVNSGSCTANWQVIPPINVSDCSKVTWTVAFKLADSNGRPPVGATFVTSDGATNVVGTSPSYASTISQTARPFTIQNLPLGRTWLKYTITDECGHSSDCYTEIDVVDTTPPTAICEGTTVVSLDESGWAELYAESVDDHSLDNCAMGYFEIKRSNSYCSGHQDDTSFGEYVNFCCEDVTAGYITVVLKVYDAAGNSNECTALVTVQNKRAPAISCPSNKTVTCGDIKLAAWASGTAAFDTTYFGGKPTVSGICSNLKFGSRIVSNNINDKCKTGTIVREWYLISDPNVYCRQTVTVVSPSFSSSNVTFPGTLTLATCDIADADPNITGSKPSVTNTTCRDIGVTFTDQKFVGVDGVCVKILRHWKVIDWCTYQSNNVIAEDIQTIKLTGSEPTEFINCTNKSVETDTGCEVEYTFETEASDQCSTPEDLEYSWKLDLGDNNSIDLSGSGNSTTHTLPTGTHRITFTVTNVCNKDYSCSYTVNVSGSKKPTPVCHREVTWVMDSDGSAEVWASDFNLKSESACGASISKYAFDADGLLTAKTFSCSDLPNGQIASIPLKMYVFDSFGNSDYCDVVLVLQDSPLTNACTDKAELLPTVSGRIVTDNNKSVQDIEVQLMNMTTTVGNVEMTDVEGKYTIKGVDVFDPKIVEASKNNDVLNGVSTFDIVMIQRHILGIEPLLSPYKILAADINNSKSVTVADLSALRKVILGINTEFENNTSWRFVPENHIFADATFPYDFAKYINIDSLFEDKENVNFIGVKVGDLNNSVQTSSVIQDLESRNSYVRLQSPIIEFTNGEKVHFSITPSQSLTSSGMQFELKFDPSILKFVGIQSSYFEAQHINANNAEQGLIRVSYNAGKGVELIEGEAIANFVFEAKNEGSTTNITIGDSGFEAEIYTDDMKVLPVRLDSRSSVSKNDITVYQNTPNPFNASTTINFDIPSSQQVGLKVMDMNGKLTFQTQGLFNKGFNSIQVYNHQLPSAGVYFYQLETNTSTTTKKMIFIE